MEANRTVKKLLVVAAGLFGLMVMVGVVDGPRDTTNGKSTAPAAYSHNELQRAADMTQQMSTPAANTGSTYHAGDEQLQRSSSVAYLRAVEQHQTDIDRMLARETP